MINRKSPKEKKRLFTRRGFIRLGVLGGIATGLTVIYNQTKDVTFYNWSRWMLRGQEERFASPALIGLASCPSYDEDILAVVRQAWKDASARNLSGARVVLKPNLVDFLDGHPSYTHPRVVEAVIRFLRDEQHAKSIVVAEGTTFRRDSQAVLVETGFEEMLRRQNVEFVDLNYDDLVTIPLKGGYTSLDRLFVARTVAEADALVSIPKLKTHHWAHISASIKNLFGIVPGIKYGWPKNTLHTKGIGEFLAELIDSLPTPLRVAVVDGIIGMEGDGPLFGSSAAAGALLVGTDFVAVDATCARLMGFVPEQVEYLTFAAWAGLGITDAARIQIKGASLESLRRPFQPPPVIL